MKTIKIKSMRLVNFKGIRDLDIQFSDDLTNITGRNGLGKTTIFDAFCWLLFDKNSDDRKTFSIKTLDENGNVIERIPHEVTAVIVVDGKEMKVFKSLNEKWVKQRGSAVEEFKGHDTVCMWNDVPMKVTEFSKRIEDEICTEQVFKMLTSPSYFTSQKMETQRSILFKMAGDMTDEQIVMEYPEFKQLFDDMSGKTMDEFKKEIGAKKRKIKAEVDSLPARIDERKREAQPEGNEYDSVHLLEIKQNELAELDKSLADVSSIQKANEDKINERSKKIFDLKSKIDKRKRDIEIEINKSYYEQTNKNNLLKAEIDNLTTLIDQRGQRAKGLADYVAELAIKLKSLRTEWSDINNQMISFDEKDFICPTCKRPFDIADIEAKKAEMLSNFNAQKVARLTENMNQGKTTKALMDAKEEELDRLSKEIVNLEAQKAQKTESIVEDIQKPDSDKAIAEDEEIKAMEAEIEKIRAVANIDAPSPRTEIIEKKAELAKEIDFHKRVIADYERHRANLKRIMELEAMLKEQNQALADLEKTEFSIQSFSKLRVEKMEQSVNSLFANVKFKMFAKQINGGEVETCEATVDGVPYADLNNAGKINCGLDIINAIIREYEISAPIFVDNAESVNILFTVPAQMVRLVVTEDNTLTIE